MTILTFPTLNAAGAVRTPNIVQWSLVANTQTLMSPFDGTTQTIANPGARWRGSLTFRNLPMGDWRALSAFVASLGGRAGRFTYGPPRPQRRAAATISGTVRVNGAGQTGTTLAIDGLPNSVVVFEIGDWISFPNSASRPQLHQITAQATSNGSGQVTLSIAPPLRGSPADDAVITHNNPVGVFMLESDDTGSQTHDAGTPLRADIQMDIIEALA